MRILQVVTLGSAQGAYGGPWSAVLSHARILAGSGNAVEILYGVVKGDEPTVAIPGVACFPRTVRPWVPGVRFSALFSIDFARTAIRRIRQADVVYVALAKDAVPLFAGFASLLLRKKVVVQPHGMLGVSPSWWHRAFNLLCRWIISRASHVIVLNEHEGECMATAFAAKKVVVLPNPVDLREVARFASKPSQDAAPEILFLARVHSRKNPEMFVRAAASAVATGATLRWSIVGPPDDAYDSIKELNSRLEYPVTIHAPVAPDEVVERVSRCDVFVLCSLDEPFGIVLMYALALGKPVVVTASSALAEEINEAGAGVVVPDGDHEALARAAVGLVADAAWGQLVGEGGRALAANFSSDLLRFRVLAAYTGLVANGL